MENEPKIYTESDMKCVKEFVNGFQILTWICLGLSFFIFIFAVFLIHKIKKLESYAIEHGYAKYNATHGELVWYLKQQEPKK